MRIGGRVLGLLLAVGRVWTQCPVELRIVVESGGVVLQVSDYFPYAVWPLLLASFSLLTLSWRRARNLPSKTVMAKAAITIRLPIQGPTSIGQSPFLKNILGIKILLSWSKSPSPLASKLPVCSHDHCKEDKQAKNTYCNPAHIILYSHLAFL